MGLLGVPSDPSQPRRLSPGLRGPYKADSPYEKVSSASVSRNAQWEQVKQRQQYESSLAEQQSRCLSDIICPLLCSHFKKKIHKSEDVLGSFLFLEKKKSFYRHGNGEKMGPSLTPIDLSDQTYMKKSQHIQ